MTLEHIRRYSTYNKLFLKMIRIISIKKLSLKVQGTRHLCIMGACIGMTSIKGVLIIFFQMKNAYTIISIIPFPEMLSFRNV